MFREPAPLNLAFKQGTLGELLSRKLRLGQRKDVFDLAFSFVAKCDFDRRALLIDAGPYRSSCGSYPDQHGGITEFAVQSLEKHPARAKRHLSLESAGSKDSDYRRGSHNAQIPYILLAHLDEVACRATLHKRRDDQVLALRATVAEDLAFIAKREKEIREFPLSVLHGREHHIVSQQVTSASCFDFRNPHFWEHRR